MQWNDALTLFELTLASQRDRPDVHASMLALAQSNIINAVSAQIQQALTCGERVWMTADLHLNHANVIRYCNRPFVDAAQMNEHLVAQSQKIKHDEWLVIVGDLAMGDHLMAVPWIRRIPGRKVLVLGNHDLTRGGKCRYLRETAEDPQQPLFEAVVPFLAWKDALGQNIFVSHYPAAVPYPMTRVLNYHGHLHRQVLPPTDATHFVNVGWDVTQGLVCL